jgi:hypothetical protein
MTVSPICHYTSFLILASAIYAQLHTANITLFNTTLLAAALVSVVHHARLDEWIVDDWIRRLDIGLWMLVAILGWTDRGYTRRWFVAMLYGAIVISLCWTSFPSAGQIPRWHASTHIVAVAAILSVS